MQNQRQNGRPDAAVAHGWSFSGAVLCGGGSDSGENAVYGKWFFCRLHSFHGIETDVCGDCDSGSLDLWGLALLKRGRSRMYWLTAVVLVFFWIHVVFLPMVVSGGVSD